jgi:hypothetical protein
MTTTLGSDALLTLEGITAQLQDLYSDWLLLRGSTATIQQQPDFSLSLLPTLPEDQAVVRQHVSDYQTDESGELLSVFQSFITMGEQFQNFGAALLPLARTLDGGQSGEPAYVAARSQFDAALAQLQTVCASEDPDHPSSVYNQVAAVKAAFDAFYDEKVEDDVVRFQTALKEAKYSGNIDKLKADLTSLQSQIDEVNGEIAQGATSEIPEALEFGMSLGEAATAELPVGMIVVNVAVQVSSEAQSASKFSQEWEARYQKLDQLTSRYVSELEELESDEQQMAVLQTLADQVGSLGATVTDVRGKLAAATASFASLRLGFEELGDMDAPTDSTYFEDQVSQGVQFWAGVAQACTRYLANARSM